MCLTACGLSELPAFEIPPPHQLHHPTINTSNLQATARPTKRNYNFSILLLRKR